MGEKEKLLSETYAKAQEELLERILDQPVHFTLHQDFHVIARDALVDAMRIQDEIIKDSEERKDEPYGITGIETFFKKSDQIHQKAMITIVFNTMLLEAIINHYIVANSSSHHFTRYYKKMDLKAKWIFAPLEISGIKLDPGTKEFEDLSKLITRRNELVHFKTKTISRNEAYKQPNIFIRYAQDSFWTVLNLFSLMGKHDPKFAFYLEL